MAACDLMKFINDQMPQAGCLPWKGIILKVVDFFFFNEKKKGMLSGSYLRSIPLSLFPIWLAEVLREEDNFQIKLPSVLFWV